MKRKNNFNSLSIKIKEVVQNQTINVHRKSVFLFLTFPYFQLRGTFPLQLFLIKWNSNLKSTNIKDHLFPLTKMLNHYCWVIKSKCMSQLIILIETITIIITNQYNNLLKLKRKSAWFRKWIFTLNNQNRRILIMF